VIASTIPAAAGGADGYPFPLWSLALAFLMLFGGPIFLLRRYWARPVSTGGGETT